MEKQENSKELGKEKKDDTKNKLEKKKIPKEKLSPAERKAKLIERYKLQCQKLGTKTKERTF